MDWPAEPADGGRSGGSVAIMQKKMLVPEHEHSFFVEEPEM